MSRFEEIVNEAIDAVVIGEALKAETLAAHIAERVRERQGGLRAEVTIRARYPEHKRTPVSGITTQELYTLIGTAVASERGIRRLVGVEAQGMTACPCAQELVAGAARERLVEQGFTDDEIERVFDAVPVATHNQRGHRPAVHRLPGGLRRRAAGRDAAADRRGLDELGDLRADEAPRRAGRGREGPPPAALRGGLRARDAARRRGRLSRPRPERLRASPARRTWRRSTSTTWSPSATGCSARSRPSSTPAVTHRHHVTMREWLESPAQDQE